MPHLSWLNEWSIRLSRSNGQLIPTGYLGSISLSVRLLSQDGCPEAVTMWMDVGDNDVCSAGGVKKTVADQSSQ